MALLVATRKGAFLLFGDLGRKKWRLEGPHMLGHIVHHLVVDPRDGRTLLMAVRAGHLGPTVYRSTDFGQTWVEAKKPPAFRKVEGGRAVDEVFWLSPGHASQKEVWYAGTTPPGLFRSDDGGLTWFGVDGLNEHPMLPKWLENAGGTPDGPKLHSILIHPKDPSHLYVGMSSGGVFESRDAGQGWRPLNQGLVADFLPPGEHEYGHDPHCLVYAPSKPDRLYQQNHCGIYRLDRPGEIWTRVGVTMPREVGDIGFPICVHPRDADSAWVFPMDGTAVWPRTSPDGRPAVYRTRNGGKSWTRLDKGLPRQQAWFTVKRQAMVNDARDPVGLYFGTTSGEIWMSASEGRAWKSIASHLPHIYALSVAQVSR